MMIEKYMQTIEEFLVGYRLVTPSPISFRTEAKTEVSPQGSEDYPPSRRAAKTTIVWLDVMSTRMI